MRIDPQSSLIDVCFIVCTALEGAGTIVVLSGGSAATFYAPEAYQSRDADFIITMKGDLGKSTAIMSELGYVEEGGVYVHAENRYTVEFPPGPLAIGEDLITTWATFRRVHDGLHLHVLDRTDAVRDRLAGFYFFKDRSALAAAVAIAAAGEVNLITIRQWSEREGEAAAFEEFLSYLSSRAGLGSNSTNA